MVGVRAMGVARQRARNRSGCHCGLETFLKPLRYMSPREAGGRKIVRGAALVTGGGGKAAAGAPFSEVQCNAFEIVRPIGNATLTVRSAGAGNRCRTSGSDRHAG